MNLEEIEKAPEVEKEKIRIMHDLRLETAPDEVCRAVATLSEEELLGVSVWEVISKRNRLRVAGAFRCEGDGFQALGLAIYRMQKHTLQIAYLGVAPAERRKQVGRSLVRAVRKVARHYPLCLSIVALVPSVPSGEEADSAPFWTAAGFIHHEMRGLDDGLACVKAEVRKKGKSVKKQLDPDAATVTSSQVLSWSETLVEARRRAGDRKAGVHSEPLEKWTGRSRLQRGGQEQDGPALASLGGRLELLGQSATGADPRIVPRVARAWGSDMSPSSQATDSESRRGSFSGAVPVPERTGALAVEAHPLRSIAKVRSEIPQGPLGRQMSTSTRLSMAADLRARPHSSANILSSLGKDFEQMPVRVSETGALQSAGLTPRLTERPLDRITRRVEAKAKAKPAHGHRPVTRPVTLAA